MKNALLIYNAILTLAVGYLFYQVNQNKNSQPVAMPSSVGDNGIVYVNTDSLLEQYNYYQAMKTGLEKKQDSIDAILKSQGAQLEREIENYQQTGAAMTEEQRAKEEERLGRKQQQYVDYRKNIIASLEDEQDQLQDSLHHHLVSYLKEMNKQSNFKFILGYQRGSGILLANDSLDITKAVIEGINKE